MKFLKVKTISSFLVINLSRITAITNTSSGISKSVITADKEKYFSIETPEEIYDKIQELLK